VSEFIKDVCGEVLNTHTHTHIQMTKRGTQCDK